MSAATLPATARPAGGGRPFAGTGALYRLALRRDRVLIPLWVLGIGGLLAAGPPGLAALYSTAAERAQAAAGMSGNSSLRALYGPVLDDSLGALVVWRYGVVAAVLTAVMSLLLVVRHTRDEEESGRQEMVSSAMVGRRAPLTAALLTAVTANLAVALVATAALGGEGLRGPSPTGSPSAPPACSSRPPPPPPPSSPRAPASPGAWAPPCSAPPSSCARRATPPVTTAPRR